MVRAGVRALLTDSHFPDSSLEAEVLSEAGVELRQAQCETEADVIAAAEGADALIVMHAPITRAVFEARPEIRIVSRCGVGVDVVDLEAAAAHGVWVANVLDYGTREVATHAFAMALALVRGLPLYDAAIRSGRWHYSSPGPLLRPQHLGFGVLGLGRIGSEVARGARPWFDRVAGCDPYLDDSDWPEGVGRVELGELFATSNVVSLHVPLTYETRHMVGRELLAGMPGPAYLVNTARGAVVDVDAVLAALEDGTLDGAGIDVLPAEPPPADHPLLRHPRALLSPHAGFYSEQAAADMRRGAAANVAAWATEGRPVYVVVEGESGASSSSG